MPPTYLQPGQRGGAETGPGVPRSTAEDARVDTAQGLNPQIKYSRIATTSVAACGVGELLRSGGFRALTVDGRALGRFSTDREAAGALLRLMAGGVA
jgi:hypothetical protein